MGPSVAPTKISRPRSATLWIVSFSAVLPVLIMLLVLEDSLLTVDFSSVLTERHPSGSVESDAAEMTPNTMPETAAFFLVDELDYNTTVSCGYYKCFFPLLNDPDEGFLVVQKGPDRLKSMRQSWALGVFIQEAFGAEQLALEEPQLVKISRETASKLNQNLYYDEEKRKVKKRFQQGTLIVQKQKRVPSPSLIFGTTRWKKHLLFENIESFLENHVSDKKAFAKQLKKELRLSKDLLGSLRCLVYDFQVFVSANGTFYHFDLDRCFRHSEQDEEKSMDRFQRKSQDLWDKVQTLIKEKV